MAIISTEINQVTKISDDLYTITEAESTHCYLIIGLKKAILFDVGYGYENIMPIVQSITDLPISIILSHGDPDHGLGSGHYESVYLHPLDLGKLLESDNQNLRERSISYRIKKLPRIKQSLDIDRFMTDNLSKTNFKFLREGDKIDLGDRIIEVVLTPGHSYGHICLLDREKEALFSGDVLTYHNIWYFLSEDEQAPFSQALASYKKLRSFIPKIKEIYPAHGVTPISPTIITEMIECLTDELKKTYLSDAPFNSFMGAGYQHIYKHVNLIYSDERLEEFLGKRIER